MTNSMQLLILGNGFDLHCGLKSSYKDFFRSEILDTYTEYWCYPKIKADCKGFGKVHRLNIIKPMEIRITILSQSN